MASLDQVLTTITQNLETPIYPNGTSNPSIVGVQVTIKSGDPLREQLDKDLIAGNARVSVFPSQFERPVTKFQREYESLTFTPPTITTVVNLQNNTVTLGGTIQTPQALMVIVDGIGYAYQVQSTDTIAIVATNTAALIPGSTATGNVITITGAHSIIARLATPYVASQEISRTERVFIITVWSPTPAIRATLEAAIDVFMKQNYRVVLPDGYFAQVFYKSINWTDMLEKDRIYRSDMSYIVQYPTTNTVTFTSIADPFVDSITFNT